MRRVARCQGRHERGRQLRRPLASHNPEQHPSRDRLVKCYTDDIGTFETSMVKTDRSPLFCQLRWPYAVGVPVLRSCETAVTSCAGANGLVKRMLLGTPWEAHWSAAAPVM